MKVDPARHRSHPWRVHSLAPDFKLLDVWHIPIEADPGRGETFDQLFDIVWENGLEAGSAPTRALVRLRSAIGRTLGWDLGEDSSRWSSRGACVQRRHGRFAAPCHDGGRGR